jgi:hypothetical protein
MKKSGAPKRKIDLRPNYSGRLQYLEALEKVSRPSTLETLSRAVGLRVRHPIDIPNQLKHPEDHWVYAGGMRWRAFCESAELGDVRRELERWQQRHEPACAANWIMDAAVQTVTLAVLREQKQPSEWLYLPMEDERSLFALRFEGEAPWWHPDLEPWPDFAKRIRATFNQQLDDYRRLRLAEAKDVGEAQAATWLARWLCRESWEQIAADNPRYGQPKSSVANGAKLFARRIGLTIPKKKPGRRPKLRSARWEPPSR